MKKLFIILTLALTSSFASASHFVPVQVVNGQDTPETEAEIVKKYHKPDGEPLPVLFKGAALRWSAMQWTPDYLAYHFGDKEVPIEIKSTHSFETFSYPLKDFLTEIEKNPDNADYLDAEVEAYALNHTFYYSGGNLELCLGDVDAKRDLNPKQNTRFPLMLPIVVEGENGFIDHQRYIFFLGSKATHTKWHNHAEVFLSQIFGKKQVLLIDSTFAAACSHFDYDFKFKKYANVPSSDYCPNFVDSQTISDNPNLKDLQIFEAILEPGDILYIPYMWLHDVKALSTSFSLAYGF